MSTPANKEQSRIVDNVFIVLKCGDCVNGGCVRHSNRGESHPTLDAVMGRNGQNADIECHSYMEPPRKKEVTP